MLNYGKKTLNKNEMGPLDPLVDGRLMTTYKNVMFIESLIKTTVFFVLCKRSKLLFNKDFHFKVAG